MTSRTGEETASMALSSDRRKESAGGSGGARSAKNKS